MTELEFRREYGFSVLERCLYHMRKNYRDNGISPGIFATFNIEMQAKELVDDILEIFQGLHRKASGE